MKPLLALALLLAGCTPAPRPTPDVMPLGNASQTQRVLTFEEPGTYQLWESASECAKDLRCREQKEWAAIYAAPAEIAALKQRVAELEARIKPSDSGTSTTTIHPTPLSWRDTSATVISAPKEDFELGDVQVYSSKDDPAKVRFHYAGGAWCNVYADKDGIHWEECK